MKYCKHSVGNFRFLFCVFVSAEPKLKNLRSMTVEDGKKTVLKCEIVAGNPAPSIKWYKNGKELTGKSKPQSIKIKKKKR